MEQKESQTVELDRFLNISEDRSDPLKPLILIYLLNETFNFEEIQLITIELLLKDNCKEIKDCIQTRRYVLNIKIQGEDYQHVVNKLEENSTCRISVTDEDSTQPFFNHLQALNFIISPKSKLECVNELNVSVEVTSSVLMKEFEHGAEFSLSNLPELSAALRCRQQIQIRFGGHTFQLESCSFFVNKKCTERIASSTDERRLEHSTPISDGTFYEFRSFIN